MLLFQRTNAAKLRCIYKNILLFGLYKRLLKSKNYLFFAGDFVLVVPTQVEEGGEVVITGDNLRLLLDIKQLGKHHKTQVF